MGSVNSRLCGNSSLTFFYSDVYVRECDVELHVVVAKCTIELKAVTDIREEKDEDPESTEPTFTETVYYEVDRPSALGGVNKYLYRPGRQIYSTCSI